MIWIVNELKLIYLVIDKIVEGVININLLIYVKGKYYVYRVVSKYGYWVCLLFYGFSI